MSQLSTNTIDLQAILAQVNALPEAGSGGGGSGEPVYASGELLITGYDTAGVMAEISGLSFRPRHVIVQESEGASGCSMTYSSSRSKYALFAVQHGWYDCATYWYRGTSSSIYMHTDTTNSTYCIEITNDGFTLSTTNAGNYWGMSYSYWAFA